MKNGENFKRLKDICRVTLCALCLFLSVTTAKAVPIAIPVVVAAESIYLALTSVTVGGVVYFAQVGYVPSVVSSSFSDAVGPQLTNNAEVSRTQKTFQGAAQLKAIAAQYTTLKNMVEDEWIQRIPAQKVAEFISAVGALEHAQIQELRINPQTLAMASAWLMPASADLSPAFVYANGDDIDFDNTLAQEFVDDTSPSLRGKCDPRDVLKHFQEQNFQVSRMGKPFRSQVQANWGGSFSTTRTTKTEMWRLFRSDGHQCQLSINRFRPKSGPTRWLFRLHNNIYSPTPGKAARQPSQRYWDMLMQFFQTDRRDNNPQFRDFSELDCQKLQKIDENDDDLCSALMRIFYGV